MSKKIKIAMPTKDNWVKTEKTKEEDYFSKNAKKNVKMKRLTIDVAENLHSQIKVFCAKKGLKMADEIRKVLEEKFTEEI